MRTLALLLLTAPMAALTAQAALDAEVGRRTQGVLPQVVSWRRDFHQHPELSNRETRTGAKVAEALRAMGLDEVRTGIAGHGVVGVLRGGRPGKVVALRADMDALPVREEVDLPFRSTARATFNGQEVGVMHACGHDAHTAMLLGAAQVLSGMRAAIAGTVVFIFQPAEEGVPADEVGGAREMVRQGVLDAPRVDAVFGLHVFSSIPTGELHVKPEGIMASSDQFSIVVRGRQTHGAMPWQGIDPVVASAQVISALQTIVSRRTEITVAPAVVTVGKITGGVRFNIIPDSVVLEGTIRAFDAALRERIHAQVVRAAESAAASVGATAEVRIAAAGNLVTYNDPALTARMTPTLQRVAGPGKYRTAVATTTAEDFSQYTTKVPGMFFFLGVTPPGTDPATVAANHSPRFFVDEGALPVGVRALATVALDFLGGR